jgi:hypothetical protein
MNNIARSASGHYRGKHYRAPSHECLLRSLEVLKLLYLNEIASPIKSDPIMHPRKDGDIRDGVILVHDRHLDSARWRE